ncbi:MULTISPECIES: DUF3325 family protein [Stutzerimonas stutzeri subgroup]|jgi:hypothetical protein|uniref:Iron uptake protein n=1 Tax=Stutzerimonas stutzeri NF13 TaxID=1212548 RepID=M2VHQ1_STUST|nr:MULTISPECIES: DUF3325 family protein [Stutzerimonas stutzeri subgroup]EMD99492.1 hypothetical protein B381_13681 [Stutzerimonas stutzeri NF13]MBK3879618.1 DUF3325 family protein [Stutzerimonas stutzeri]MBS68847.1 DUF3325 domain-containing protein [Pseudomonas sp.]MCQ4291369.1 DUF3325 domain-containing protein [Stutzerimonas stutzeri]
MLLLAFALAYLGMTLLCLSMNRHRGALLRADTRLPGPAIIRSLAVGCFGFALWLGINSQGGEIGTVVWLCLVMLSGLLLVLLLAWRSRWVLPVAPLLAACGVVQGVL